jgi:hypothetical protein
MLYRIIYDEPEGMWKEAFMAHFNVLSQNLPGWAEIIHKVPQM